MQTLRLSVFIQFFSLNNGFIMFFLHKNMNFLLNLLLKVKLNLDVLIWLIF